jgi:hypothetical protein
MAVTYPVANTLMNFNYMGWQCISLLSMAQQPFVWPWPLFSSLILYTVGRAPWTGDQPVARPLPIHRTTQTQNKRTQMSVPVVGFKPTTPMFNLAKMVHALDRAATVISGWQYIVGLNYF